MSINNPDQIQLTEREEGQAMEEPEMPNPLDGLNNQLSKKMSKQERDEQEQIAKTMLAKADELKAERDKELE